MLNVVTLEKIKALRTYLLTYLLTKINVCTYGKRSNAILEMIMKGEYLQIADPDVKPQNAALFATINTLLAKVDK